MKQTQLVASISHDKITKLQATKGKTVTTNTENLLQAYYLILNTCNHKVSEANTN